MKTFAFIFSALAIQALATTYGISDTVIGSSFLNFFEFEAIQDPTHGRVNYVDKSTAAAQNLTFGRGSTFILRADSQTVLDPSGPGRNSVRIRSKKTYTHHVAVFDVRHMPQGCGTWPAIWETNEAQWPNGGEIDIVEGVNDQSPNAATLHTNAGCTMPANRNQAGTSGQLDCDWLVNYNTGCGVKFPTANSYGPPFNSNGGGWYAVERSSTQIRVFFWPRDSDCVPSEVRHGTISVDPDNWGIPVAIFPNTSCDLHEHFTEHNIIINLTFCGDWAGAVYGQSGCPSTCVDFVNNNPGAFSDAFFDFASIRVYQPWLYQGIDVAIGATSEWVDESITTGNNQPQSIIHVSCNHERCRTRGAMLVTWLTAMPSANPELNTQPPDSSIHIQVWLGFPLL